jgi:hypothetical protein
MLILPLFMLFKTSMRAMLILVFVFMLFNLTSMRAMFILVSEIVMIYVLILIWKLHTFSTGSWDGTLMLTVFSVKEHRDGRHGKSRSHGAWSDRGRG